MDSYNVLAIPDPWEVIAIASGLIKIDWVIMTGLRLRSDAEFSTAKLAD